MEENKDQTAFDSFRLPESEKEVGDGKPFIFRFGKHSAFSPPPVVTIGLGDKQAKYEKWLDQTFREQFTLFDKPSNSKVRLDQLRRFHVFCQAAVKEKEAMSVTYEVHPQAAPKGLDIGRAIQKLVQENLGLLYNIAPQFGIKTKQPVSIDEVAASEEPVSS